MGIENPVHLIFLGAIALIFLGPRRLPELAKALGQGVREFREAISDGVSPAVEQPLGEVARAQGLAPEPLVTAADLAPAKAPGPEPPVTVAETAPAQVPGPEPLASVVEPVPAPEGPSAVDPDGSLPSGDAPDRRPL